MQIPTEEVSYAIGNAISLIDDNGGKAVLNNGIYAMIRKYVAQKAEDYKKAVLLGVFILVYLVGMQVKEFPLSSDEIDTKIWQLMNAGIGGEPQIRESLKTSAKAGNELVKIMKAWDDYRG